MRPLSKLLSIVVFGVLLTVWLHAAGQGDHTTVNVGGGDIRPVVATRTRGGSSTATRRSSAAVQTGMKKLQRDFVNDPSFDARCKAPPIAVDRQACPNTVFQTTEIKPILEGPISRGETTAGMTVQPMDLVVRSSSKFDPKVALHKVDSVVAHHPVFFEFAKHTYHDTFFADRVMEFNGAHAKFSYDCTPGIDFRNYHQVRAAMCAQHEKHMERHAADQVGYFPLMDEEYFEYVATLSTALDAAENNRPYTFIELGARYGTWIVRAGASYRHAGGAVDQLQLLAVEGNCEWFRKMEEHVACNGLTNASQLILSYAAPKSYNSIDLKDRSTYTKARAVSLIDMLNAYDVVDMMDFDIQGFEALAVEEPTVMALMEDRVAFVHFGTHSTDIEGRLLHAFDARRWVLVYGFAGAHTKKLERGHMCDTPFGPSRYNDGAWGYANRKFYRTLSNAPRPVFKRVNRVCYWDPVSLTIIRRSSLPEGGQG